MQPICEAHPQLLGVSQGLHLTLLPPTVVDEPILQGETDADAAGVSIYGSVIRDGGLFRMWYQAWPRDWNGSDAVTVACVESDDGLIAQHRAVVGIVGWVVLEVVSRQDRNHAGQILGLGGVDPRDLGVRDRAAQDLCVEHARNSGVGKKLEFSADLFSRLQSIDRLTNNIHSHLA